MAADVDTQPVGPADLAALATLFGSQRNTRHCWCTAFCVPRGQFAAGWFGGGNRRRFEGMAAQAPTPMGVLGLVDGEPIGWCACGPRSRYRASSSGRQMLHHRTRAEDEWVWLVACLFVRSGFRGQGVTSALVRSAIRLARDHGAAAIEAWPVTGPDPQAADAFLGREKTFEHLGFRCVERPSANRSIMRLELPAT